MQKVLLVRLSRAQSEAARKANRNQKDYTHAVICGEYGQLFGTETFCRKYFSAWSRIFPLLFDGGVEINSMEIHNFSHTTDLTTRLGEQHAALARAADPMWRHARARRNSMEKPRQSKQRWALVALAVLVLGVLAVAAANAQEAPAATREEAMATMFSVGLHQALAEQCRVVGQITDEQYAKFITGAIAYAKQGAGNYYDSEKVAAGYREGRFRMTNGSVFEADRKHCKMIALGSKVYRNTYN